MRRELPFTIQDVVRLLNLTVRRSHEDSFDVDCPLCGVKQGKMNINTMKQVWYCYRCGEGGSAIGLYIAVNEAIGNGTLTYAEAFRQIMRDLESGTVYQLSCRNIDLFQEPSVPQSPYAGDEAVHQTLSSLMELLNLADTHREKLRARGLTDPQIEQLGFKSTPAFGFRQMTKWLMEKGCAVSGVPGFYQEESGAWSVNFRPQCPGILIPVKTLSGMIQGLKIRLDYPKDSMQKYMWFSSSKRYLGRSAGSPAHFIGNPCSETVYITEGPLKADVAYCLSGKSFLALPGANNWKKLMTILPLLKQNGVRVLVETMDMDKKTKDIIAKAADRILIIGQKYGFEVRSLSWDDKYKGIDDWLFAQWMMKRPHPPWLSVYDGKKDGLVCCG